jgi:hypothetical protein
MAFAMPAGPHRERVHHVAEVLLFHHAHGLTPGVRDFAGLGGGHRHLT